MPKKKILLLFLMGKKSKKRTHPALRRLLVLLFFIWLSASVEGAGHARSFGNDRGHGPLLQADLLVTKE